MFKLFLGVLSISTCCVYSADQKRSGKETFYVLPKKADGMTKVRALKNRFIEETFKCDTDAEKHDLMDKVAVIQKGNESVQQNKYIGSIINTCKAALDGIRHPHELDAKVPLNESSIQYYKAIVQVLEQGVNVSKEEDKVLEKDTEYVVLLATKKQ
jgi:hypothetical protein